MVGAIPVFLEAHALPSEHRRAARRNGRSSVVLGGEDVAARPADFSPKLDQRFDEHRGLNGHVQGAGDADAFERTLGCVAGTDGHEARHFMLGDADFKTPEFGEGFVGDQKRRGHGAGLHAPRARPSLKRLPLTPWVTLGSLGSTVACTSGRKPGRSLAPVDLGSRTARPGPRRVPEQAQRPGPLRASQDPGVRQRSRQAWPNQAGPPRPGPWCSTGAVHPVRTSTLCLVGPLGRAHNTAAMAPMSRTRRRSWRRFRKIRTSLRSLPPPPAATSSGRSGRHRRPCPPSTMHRGRSSRPRRSPSNRSGPRSR